MTKSLSCEYCASVLKRSCGGRSPKACHRKNNMQKRCMVGGEDGRSLIDERLNV